MDISDVQVSDKDGEKSRSNTVKASSKIVKERIWKLDSRFAGKIVFQPLEIDTDAQFAQGACDFSEERSRICISSSIIEMSQVECGHPGNFLSM